MQFKVDDEVVYELSDEQLNILKSNIDADILTDDLKRRVKWVIENKLKNVTKELNEKWFPILSADNAMLPSNPDELAKMALNHPEYKDISTLKNTIKS